ncbi:MAG: hypothetical protein ACRC2M_08550, partial [Planktothrix sp.]
EREERFLRSSQLSLGELIAKIETAGLTYNNQDRMICFDFGTAVPTNLDSWRGSYCELALGYRVRSLRCDNYNDSYESPLAKDILADLKSAVGGVFEGWKGGEFTMNEDTPIWVDNPGNSSLTGVFDILATGMYLIIIAGYCEY